MDLKRLKREYNVPWIAETGEFDYSLYPIEHPTKDSLSIVDQKFVNACRILGLMTRENRIDAGMFLIGLIIYYKGNIERLEILVENLKYFKIKICSDFLFAELLMTENIIDNKKYLDLIVDLLGQFPQEIVKEKFVNFSIDNRFNDSMRKRFLKIIKEFENSN